MQWSLGYLWPTGGLASDVIRREQNSYSGYSSSSEITIRVGSISKSMYIVDTIDSNLAVRKVYLNETIAWIASIATQLMLKSEEIDSQEQNIFLGLQLRVISYFFENIIYEVCLVNQKYKQFIIGDEYKDIFTRRYALKEIRRNIALLLLHNFKDC